MGAFQISDSSKLRLRDESANIPFPKFHLAWVLFFLMLEFINTDTEFLFWFQWELFIWQMMMSSQHQERILI